jgi:hypothetical protein
MVYRPPLSMVYWPPYPWYFDPPPNGISNPLSMVFSWLEMRGSKYHGDSIFHTGGSIFNKGGGQYTMDENWPRSQFTMGFKIPQCMTPILSSFITYHRICNQINTSTTSGAGATYLSRVPEFTPVFSGVCVTRSLVLSVCFVDHVCPFVIFCHSVVRPLIYRFLLALWYLETLLKKKLLFISN